MNVWTFTARLGADAELKHVGDSTVTEFRSAVASGYGSREQTTWVRCNMWGKRGEALLPYLNKGQQVAVSGELTNREYELKEGGKGYSLEVRVNDLTLVGSKPQQNSPPAANTPHQTPVNSPPVTASEPQEGFTDDDIPF